MRWLLPLFALAAALLPAALKAEDAPAGKIAYSRKTGDQWIVHVMNADGKDDRALPGQTANVNLFATWSPDGRRISITSSPSVTGDEFTLALFKTDGTSVPVPPPAKRCGLSAWSADGKHLAFVSGENEPVIYVGDGDGQNARQVSPPETGAVFPFWSPDGKLGYTRFGGGEMKSVIVLGKADGTDPKTLVEVESAIAGAGPQGLSPDGKKLLYVAANPMEMTVSVRMLEIETKAENTIGDFKLEGDFGPQHLTAPAWAPDGKSYLAVLSGDGGRGLFRISADGKTRTRLTPAGVEVSGASWTAPKPGQ